MRVAVTLFAALALAACVGTPPIERVAAQAETTGACTSLPDGVTCECVISTAHAAIPTTSAPRISSEETGSRTGRGTMGVSDPRVAVALANAKQSCAAGKAVG
jgi:hypothetical protein